jgi:hypothetical protein
LTTSQLDVCNASLRGVQLPRICHLPDGVDAPGREAIEVARIAGLELDPWEEHVLLGSLRERPDHKWAAFEFGLVVARQNGKGTCLEARELAGLFAFGERLLIHSAHEQATSSEHFRRLLNLMEGVPEFDQRILKAVRGKGSEAIELRGGQRIFFKTRTGGGGRGLTGDFVALDEAMILPVATTAALVPTMAARSIEGNPQLWYAGSAVDEEKHEHGVVLARVRERALHRVARLGYMEWSAEGDDPDRVPPEVRSDPEVWAQANPGLGIRISVEHVANERAGALGAREFAVERLGVGAWPDTSEEADRTISREAFAAIAEHDRENRITSVPRFGVDMNPDRTRAAIGVAGTRDDGLAQFAVVEHGRGSGWVVDRCVELQREHRKAKFVLDARGPAASLIPELKEASVRVVEASTQDYANACGDFFDAVDQKTARYPAPQPDLDDALANARTATLGDKWKWHPRSSTSADITTLVACTLALWGALRHKPRKPRVINLAEVLASAQNESKEN